MFLIRSERLTLPPQERVMDGRSKRKEANLLWLDFMDELANKVEQDMPATLSDFVACVTAACESDITDK